MQLVIPASAPKLHLVISPVVLSSVLQAHVTGQEVWPVASFALPAAQSVQVDIAEVISCG